MVSPLGLTLPLLMLGIDADDPHHALAVDQLAFYADFFNRRANFHFIVPSSLSRPALRPATASLSRQLLYDSRPGEIAFGELNFHPVARQ